MDAAAAGTACRSAETARNRLLIANAPRKIRADTGEPGGPKRLLDANHHFAIGLVRFHRLACLANIVELKDASRFGLIDSSGRFIHDGLKRNVRDWKVWSAEYKAAKKCEVNSARHLKQRVEVIHGIETTEPSREAHTATPPQHGKRIHECGVPDKIEDGIDPFAFRDSPWEVRPFNLHSMSSEFFQRLKSCLLASSGNNVSADVGRNIKGRATQSGCCAPDDQRLTLSNLQVTKQARPSGRVLFRDYRKVFPPKISFNRYYVSSGGTCIFSIAAVDGAPKATHECGHFGPDRELPSRARFYQANALPAAGLDQADSRSPGYQVRRTV